MDRDKKAGDRIVRRPRLRDVSPAVVKMEPLRHPTRYSSPPMILFYSFALLIIIGGLLLMLPSARAEGGSTSADIAFFTATSAVTVTGHTVVNTAEYWTNFGHGVIFTLMLVGGLGFTTIATFFLILLGQRSTLPERMLMRDTMGVDRMGGLVAVLRNIILIVLSIYVVGMVLVWWHIHELFPAGEAFWQAAFLSVSAFNNAGFSILPDAGSLENFFDSTTLLVFVAILIILGSIGWTTLVDLFKQKRFSRFTLDSKMVITASLALWILGALVFFIAEYGNEATLGNVSVAQKGVQSIFHSISGRTAGLVSLDFSKTTELTDLFYPFLMFVGGAAGSIAGGIKVATLAVIVAAVVSSIRGRFQAEAFDRGIPQSQVNRALTVAALGIVWLFIVSLVLTLTEEDIPFLHLWFDTVSAFGTTGLSTGVPPQLSLAGKALFMVTMFVGRLGPLTLALALAPKEETTVYRFAEERVKIG